MSDEQIIITAMIFSMAMSHIFYMASWLYSQLKRSHYRHQTKIINLLSEQLKQSM